MIIKQFACIATALSLGSIAALAITLPSQANPISATASAKQQNSSTLRQGIPGRRLGGGTRQDVVFTNAADSLTALTTLEPLTITAAENPSLMFHIPQMRTANNVEFVILNAQDELIYEKTFAVAPEAGIVSVDLADGSAASILDVDADYQWYFSIIPNVEDRASDVVVHGGIRRVDQAAWISQQATDTNLDEQLAMAEPLTKARILYQQANLWQDAVALLYELRQAEPENVAIANEWNQLLESAELSGSL